MYNRGGDMCVSWLNFSNSLSIFPLHTPHHVEAFQKTNLIARAQQVKTCGRNESEGWGLSDAASFFHLPRYIPPCQTETSSSPISPLKTPSFPTNFPLIPRIEKSRVFRMPLLNHFQVINDVA
ncbi:uncharacterized protein CCOS01_07037 [Colletotrichum costaricense]|uniref:Uncharacterized protein n=1 Tax=Colletotrichum costaricense TaxID=1209916 RepID=A0AAI9Z0H6_9PEZI|nr:uncharacterized protein CCOS01_07037 [Colletotrichum costaricense]KAK1529203.1 hypothetical protein CCOS01_07037 [Colletotrichum costaricense]